MIYKPKGRAAEYCELAINHYLGCQHGCTYCYAGNIRGKGLEPRPRKLISFPPGTGLVHLSFLSDPYQPVEAELGLTRQVITRLHQAGYFVSLLTKGGALAQRDFDLLGTGDRFGVTLTLSEEEDSRRWEPYASLPQERIENLRAAHERGIYTWVSLEPVLYPVQTYALIEASRPYVDEYWVGKLNWHPHALTIDWPQFTREVCRVLKGSNFHLKSDLRSSMSSSIASSV
jgi:DNA repair photolyase